jgi:hypothetical protein
MDEAIFQALFRFAEVADEKQSRANRPMGCDQRIRVSLALSQVYKLRGQPGRGRHIGTEKMPVP